MSSEARIEPWGGGGAGRGCAAPMAFPEDTGMTKDQKIIRAKVGVLELAKQLGNVAR